MATKTTRTNRHTALDALVRKYALALAESHVASDGAETNLGTLSCLECLATPIADVGRTCSASFLVRLRLKYLAAGYAMSKDAAIRESRCLKEEWVRTPKLIVQFGMTLPTKCFQVISGIGFQVGREETERDQVMDSQSPWSMASFALASGSGKYDSLLHLPIWASIPSVPAAPCWILVTGESPFRYAHQDNYSTVWEFAQWN